MEINQLENLLRAANFDDIERLNEYVVRGVKKENACPYAVYYWDISNALPSTKEDISKYQSAVIADRYFRDTKSLQWNNYLYFVQDQNLSDFDTYKKAKHLIERDKNYARKFVVNPSELDKILNPPIIVPSDTTPRVNILSTWIDILESNGLYDAVINDHNLPTRMRLIREIETSEQKDRYTPNSSSPIYEPPFINSLKLERYRDYPKQRFFEFGKVNLIVGNNGTGKTSLLEALELYYCGRNKRNSDMAPSYEFIVSLDDETADIVTEERDKKQFRINNLAWYGQPEIKTNNIYLSFSQYNFLDTDAAVSIATATKDIKDNLSKLLVGGDTSRAWSNIELVNDRVGLELSGHEKQRREIERELSDVNKIIENEKGLKRESDVLYLSLDEVLKRNNWNVPTEDKGKVSEYVIKVLSELVPILNKIDSLDWLGRPITISKLIEFSEINVPVAEKAKKGILELEKRIKSVIDIKDSLRIAKDSIKILQQAEKMIDAGVIELSAAVKECVDVNSKNSNLLFGADKYDFGIIPKERFSRSLGEYIKEIDLSLHNQLQMMGDSQKRYQSFIKGQDESQSLAQQLRNTAEKLLERHGSHDECPLCHTTFEQGELLKRMSMRVDGELDKVGRQFLSEIEQRKKVIDGLHAQKNVAIALQQFQSRARLPEDISIETALKTVDDVKRELRDGNERIRLLKSNIEALEQQGISISEFEKLIDQLQDSEYGLADYSKESLNALREIMNSKISDSSQFLESERSAIEQLQEELKRILKTFDSEIGALSDSLNKLIERLTISSNLQKKLKEETFNEFLWPSNKDTKDVLFEFEAVQSMASNLQNAVEKEALADKNTQDALKRKVVLESKLKSVTDELEKLRKALSVLTDIVKNHSLESAMEQALEDNRNAIQSIFGRIHAPAEFEKIGPDWNHLIRKNGKVAREAKLTEISAGQRAAFALSVFLSQNAQLSKAPPVVLVDDPIAHVDDLNALSFLDYLRDLTLTGKRQIFFATASSKLAALFERKFDFLRDGFRRIDLVRE